MAKRKTATARTRKTTRARAAASASRKPGRKVTRPVAKTARRAARKPVKRATVKAARTSATPARKAPGRKTVAPKAVTRSAVARKAPAAPVSRKAAGRAAPRTPAVPKKAPALNRARRTVSDIDFVPSPPSSLDLNRTASAVRSGRHEMAEHQHEITQSGPTLTAGDVDADWESAYSTGDEAPGGDNPTPDQDVVDDIGRAVGVEYADNEELKGEGKITQRDRHRWELDPASSEDYKDR